MLSIRMQRTGRRGHAQFRVVVQDARFNPKSGRVVAYLGSYDPHTKVAKIDGEKTGKFLDNGAQPSDRIVRILQTKLSRQQSKLLSKKQKLQKQKNSQLPKIQNNQRKFSQPREFRLL
jgi:small subunit ribosomal protein S16